MKKVLLNGSILFLFTLNACKKNEPVSASQGNNFTLLLKTVTKVNTLAGVKELVAEYSYNTNNQLSKIIKSDNIASSNFGLQTEIFYRNAIGHLDSIVYSAKDNGVVSSTVKTFFTYDAGGKLILSIKYADYNSGSATKDSSLYIYTGGVLQKRTDYRSFDRGLHFILLLQAAYEFDATGNLSKSVFQWTTNPLVDTLTFQYDTKPNPIPAWAGVGYYWSPLFFYDYTPIHNVTKANGNNDYNNINFEYQYAPNNKPLYRKQIQPGGLDNSETYFYYD